MNDYSLTGYYKQNGKSKTLLSKKQLNEIDKRRLYAMKLNDIQEVEQLKDSVLNEIASGLNKDIELDREKRLKTAFNTLPYIAPQKKQVETTVITRNIEDLIKEDIEEAEIIDNDKID